MENEQSVDAAKPERTNPLMALPVEQRWAAAARDYQSAAQVYRALIARLGMTAAIAADERLSPQTRQFLGIVYGSGIGYMEQGAAAIDAATERLRQAAAVPLPALDPAPAVPPAFEAPLTLGQMAVAAKDYQNAARMLYSLVERLTDDAEAVANRQLTGDTHPYGDVIYGIVIPYLLQSAEALVDDINRMAAEEAAGATE